MLRIMSGGRNTHRCVANVSWSPGLIGVSTPGFRRSLRRKVPLRESRSSTCHRRPSRRSRAWRLETLPVGRITSAGSLRPTTTSGASGSLGETECTHTGAVGSRSRPSTTSSATVWVTSGPVVPRVASASGSSTRNGGEVGPGALGDLISSRRCLSRTPVGGSTTRVLPARARTSRACRSWGRRNRVRVSPNCSSCPLTSGCPAPAAQRRPSRQVPFCEPRSSTSQLAPRRCTCACWVETEAPPRRRSPPRPTITALSALSALPGSAGTSRSTRASAGSSRIRRRRRCTSSCWRSGGSARLIRGVSSGRLTSVRSTSAG